MMHARAWMLVLLVAGALALASGCGDKGSGGGGGPDSGTDTDTDTDTDSDTDSDTDTDADTDTDSDTDTDTDTDTGTGPDLTPEPLCAAIATSADQAYGAALASDSQDNAIVGGYFTVDIDFGEGPIASLGDIDGFVAKYAPDCGLLWSVTFGDLGQDQVMDVAVDADDNVIATGLFYGTINLGGDDLVSPGDSWDVFVVEYDPAGNHLWSERFGGTGHDKGTSLAVDSVGQVIVTGAFEGDVDFGGGTLTATEGDAFLLTLDGDGNHVDSQAFGSSGEDGGFAVALVGDDDVLVGGSVGGEADLGGGPLPFSGDAGVDAFAARFDSDGNHVWSTAFGGTQSDAVQAIAADSSGSAVVAGRFEGEVDFGDGPVTSAGSTDMFLVKLDPGGAHVWSETFGAAQNDQALGLALDAADNVAFTGFKTGSVDLGGEVLLGLGWRDIFVANTDPDGAHVFSLQLGGIWDDSGRAVAIDSSSSFLVTGSFQNMVDFGDGPVTAAGDCDMFLVKLVAE